MRSGVWISTGVQALSCARDVCEIEVTPHFQGVLLLSQTDPLYKNIRRDMEVLLMLSLEVKATTGKWTSAPGHLYLFH